MRQHSARCAAEPDPRRSGQVAHTMDARHSDEASVIVAPLARILGGRRTRRETSHEGPGYSACAISSGIRKPARTALPSESEHVASSVETWSVQQLTGLVTQTQGGVPVPAITLKGVS